MIPRFCSLYYICCEIKGIPVARWHRAERLGLDPPQQVKEIIEAAEGAQHDMLNTAVWEGRV